MAFYYREERTQFQHDVKTRRKQRNGESSFFSIVVQHHLGCGAVRPALPFHHSCWQRIFDNSFNTLECTRTVSNKVTVKIHDFFLSGTAFLAIVCIKSTCGKHIPKENGMIHFSIFHSLEPQNQTSLNREVSIVA